MGNQSRAFTRIHLAIPRGSPGVAPATYVAVLTRVHLRNLASLPKAEYLR